MNGALDRREAISIAELRTGAALLERIERKYVVTTGQAQALLERLDGLHRVLEIDGRREFRYRTTYYDTPELVLLRDHLQGRRRRFKCRRRVYVDTGDAMLEVKYRGVRGSTLKQARSARHEPELLDEEAGFFRDAAIRACGRPLAVDRLAPTLTVEAVRVTLAAPPLAERVTLDVAVDLPGWRLGGGLVIVESKSRTGRATADRALRGLGVAPVACSKYCVGMALTGDVERANAYRPVIRHFVPETCAMPG
jgi:hypothetical protein